MKAGIETHSIGRRVWLALLIGLFAAAVAVAQTTYELVHAFRGSGQPTSLIRATDGSLYGTTSRDGTHASGSIFRVDSSNQLVTVHSFGPYGRGRNPYGYAPAPHITITQAIDGNFYGTTNRGGDHDLGTFFVMNASGEVSVIHSFTPNDGARPHDPLIQGTDGNFYGTSPNGPGDDGAVFRIDTEGHLVLLHVFNRHVEGARPVGGLVQASDGNFYGTTSGGGANDKGTVFKMDPWGDITTLHTFDGEDGSGPSVALIEASNGILVGSTFGGGTYGYGGTVFQISKSGDFSTLHSFNQDLDGSGPTALTEAPGGDFYGAASGRGPGHMGTLFSLTPAGDFTVRHSFSGSDGSGPASGFALGSDNDFYGVCVGGGANGVGTFYKIDDSGSFVSLRSFDGGKEPSSVFTKLLHASDGNIYGTSDNGGTNGLGSIFRLDSFGELTILHSFAEGEGSAPYSAVIQAIDGKLYGTASNGGANGSGSIFAVDFLGNFETLHHFNGLDGSNPDAALMQAPDGSFYGTASYGVGGGRVFRMDSSGGVATIHNFNNLDGAFPRAPVVLGSDGFLYGTTEAGGDNDLGTIFQVLPSGGEFSSLHSFEDISSQHPRAAVIQATDGNFYGMTPENAGAVFRINSVGDFATLHFFRYEGDEPGYPSGPLMRASDGALYGTSSGGGSPDGEYPGHGTVFRTGFSGVVTLVHTFHTGFGREPIGGVVQTSDGSLCGAATTGGPFGNLGVIFRLSTAPVAVNEIWPTSGPAAGDVLLDVLGGGFDSDAGVTVGGIGGTGINVLDSTFLYLSAPPLSPGSLNDVSVTVSTSTIGTATATHPIAFFADFLDVPQVDPFHDYVERIFRNGITAGCGTGFYCPLSSVTRAQMAVFLLKAEHGSAYLPPPCTKVFADVPCPSMFADWIEQLAAEGVTAGCGGDNYCPGNLVTRAQMAVFLLKTRHGPSFDPPDCTGIFADVPCPSLFARWIEQLAAEEITGGCGGGNYCPDNPNTRAQMSAFLVKTFHLY